MDATPEGQPIPQRLSIEGTTGNNAFVVNGSFELQKGLYNHRPFWQKTTDTKIFLSFMSNNRWYVTVAAHKDVNQPGGWLKGEGGFLPTSVLEWSVVNAAQWEMQPVQLRVESNTDDRLLQVVASALEGAWLVVDDSSQGRHRFRVRGGRILDSYGLAFIEGSQPLAYRFSDGARMWKATLSACNADLSQLTWSSSDESNREIYWEKQLGGPSPQKRAAALIGRLGSRGRGFGPPNQESAAQLSATAGLVGTGYKAAPIRKRRAKRIRHISEVLRSPAFKTVTICGASGALVLSPIGGAFGCAGGVLIGGVAGTVPALVTFGASIPAGAAIGGLLGAPLGVCAFSLLGVAAGGTSAAAYVWRSEIKDGMVRLRVEVLNRRRLLFISVIESGASACGSVGTLGCQVTELGRRARGSGAKWVKSPRVQATVAGASLGVATGGTVGGAAGLVTGAGAGALAGVPAALFTLGLSIPLGAALGGSLGCAAGAGVGGATGGAIAGTAGYQAHKHRDGLRTGAAAVLATLRLKRKASPQLPADACEGCVGDTGGTEAAAKH